SVGGQPGHGTVVVYPDGSFVYTPFDASYVGPDSFTYTASDGVLSSQATVSIVVTDQAPVAQPATYGVQTDQPLMVSAAVGLLTYASDPDGDPLTAAQAGGQPQHGTVVVNSDGSFTYTPTDPGFHGTDSFQYKVNDRALDSNLATVTLDVHASNNPPV